MAPGEPDFPFPHEQLRSAFAAHRSGRLDEAERIYLQVLDRDPNHAEALHHLGLVRHQQGRTPEGLELVRRAIAIAPAEPRYHYNLFSLLDDNSLQGGGNSAEAESARQDAARALGWSAQDCLRQGQTHAQHGEWTEAGHAAAIALALDPTDDEARLLLARSAFNRKRYPLAHAALQLLSAAARARAAALHLLAATQEKLGLREEAEASQREARLAVEAEARPHLAAGTRLQRQGRHREAAEEFAQALELQPEHGEAQFSLGNSLTVLGETERAMAAFREALRLMPDDARVLNNLANLLYQAERYAEAEPLIEKALRLNPNIAEAHGTLGNMRRLRGRYDEAVQSFETAIRLKPDLTDALNNLANIRLKQCEIEAAIELFARLTRFKPEGAMYFSNWLFARNYLLQDGADRFYEDHRIFARRFEQPARWPARYANSADPERRIRVGIASAQLKQDPITIFMEPYFQLRDPRQTELICFSTVSAPDEVTARLKARADRWVPCKGLRDEEIAGLVRDMEIDILIDLAGHCGDNLLPTFALKPAPIQVSYLGYLRTTGLAGMDYYLTDAELTPPDSQCWFSERLYPLAGFFACFQNPGEFPTVVAPPVARNGFVTFGCYNNASKISPQVMRTWCRLLETLPDSRLILRAPQFADGPTRERVAGRFTAQGIARERLDLLPSSPTRAEYLADYGRIDIALDPFPYNGVTTTCEALWMGVPVVVLDGEYGFARAGVSILKHLGHPEWIASSEDAYIELAAKLAEDSSGLAAIRASLRGEMARSPLCDGPAYSKNMDAAFREMWRSWCGNQAKVPQ